MTTLKQLRGRPAPIPDHPVNGLTRKMRETFQDAPSRNAYALDAEWPECFHELGQGRSVSYTSNKWKDDPGEFEDFKHVAESRNITYASDLLLSLTGLKRTADGDRWPMRVPNGELPPTLAELAPCLFLEVRLIHSTEPRMRLEKQATVIPLKQSMLYGGYFRPEGGSWKRRGDLVPFLTVIQKGRGVLAFITGTDLDVSEDGIVG